MNPELPREPSTSMMFSPFRHLTTALAFWLSPLRLLATVFAIPALSFPAPAPLSDLAIAYGSALGGECRRAVHSSSPSSPISPCPSSPPPQRVSLASPKLFLASWPGLAPGLAWPLAWLAWLVSPWPPAPRPSGTPPLRHLRPSGPFALPASPPSRHLALRLFPGSIPGFWPGQAFCELPGSLLFSPFTFVLCHSVATPCATLAVPASLSYSERRPFRISRFAIALLGPLFGISPLMAPLLVVPFSCV